MRSNEPILKMVSYLVYSKKGYPMNQLFRVEKQNIYQTNQASIALEELEAGEVRLAIDHYALTTNNITYAVSGFKL